VKPLADKLALVTGASGIIGAAIAMRLARDGAYVLAHYGSGRAAADAVVREIVDAGGHAEALGADLSERDGARALIAQIDDAFGARFGGRLDVLVNNAGRFDFDALTEATDDAFDRIFNVNVRAVFQLSRDAARRMSVTGAGRIITIGSVFGESTPAAGLSLYCGTKFAVRGFTRAWSRDLGPVGITVNNVQPALIQAEPVPTAGPAFEAMQQRVSVGRFGTAGDVAAAVAFLAHPDAAFITGESLNVDGGWSALPGAISRRRAARATRACSAPARRRSRTAQRAWSARGIG
jgi:3-oxoacyl-[acyl-carrier protein] reductase